MVKVSSQVEEFPSLYFGFGKGIKEDGILKQRCSYVFTSKSKCLRLDQKIVIFVKGFFLNFGADLDYDILK